MPTERQVQVGDLYYLEPMCQVFEVVGQSVGDHLSWIMTTELDGYTTLMPTKGLDHRGWRYAEPTGPDFKVVVGSTWYPRRVYGHNELFTVIRSNDNHETGPDSWVMEGRNSYTFYMHHDRRMKGEWLHVGTSSTVRPTSVVRRSRYHRNLVI
jgi:hypothetical protein